MAFFILLEVKIIIENISNRSLKTEHCCDVWTSTRRWWLRRYEDDKNVIITLLTVFKNIDLEHYFSVTPSQGKIVCLKQWLGMGRNVDWQKHRDVMGWTQPYLLFWLFNQRCSKKPGKQKQISSEVETARYAGLVTRTRVAGGEPACARFSSTDLGHFTRPRANGSFFFFFAFCAFNLRQRERECTASSINISTLWKQYWKWISMLWYWGFLNDTERSPKCIDQCLDLRGIERGRCCLFICVLGSKNEDTLRDCDIGSYKELSKLHRYVGWFLSRKFSFPSLIHLLIHVHFLI